MMSSSTLSFPHQLHHALAAMEREGLAHIASWQPHGRAFKVHSRDDFVKIILPRWFRQSKFSSFQRQLNIYGFDTVRAGPDSQSYYHEHFLRNQPLLVNEIKRIAIKGPGPRRAATTSITTVPNFGRLPPCPPVTVNRDIRHALSTEINDQAHGSNGISASETQHDHLLSGSMTSLRLLSAEASRLMQRQEVPHVTPSPIVDYSPRRQITEPPNLLLLVERRQEEQTLSRREELLLMMLAQQEGVDVPFQGARGISTFAGHSQSHCAWSPSPQLQNALYLEQARQRDAHRNALVQEIAMRSLGADRTSTLAASSLPVASTSTGLPFLSESSLQYLLEQEIIRRIVNP